MAEEYPYGSRRGNADGRDDPRLGKMVKIYEDTRVEVVLNYSEDREKLETVLKELEAEYGDR